jgi:hypothetical protein
MEPEGSLPFSQDTAAGPYHEPNESTPYLQDIKLVKIMFKSFIFFHVSFPSQRSVGNAFMDIIAVYSDNEIKQKYSLSANCRSFNAKAGGT